jgi:FkbM family methyltransferase
MPGYWQVLRVHLRGIRTGARRRDQFKIAVLIALRLLVPFWALLRRFGVLLPAPVGLMGWYRIRDRYGMWEVHGSGGPAWIELIHGGGAVGMALDRLEAGTLVDVGASYGYFTVRCARRIGDRGSVVAIEAHPQRYQELRRSLALNGLGNVAAVWCAAGDFDGPVTLYEPPFSLGRTDPSVTSQRGTPFTVPMRSVDAICSELGLTDVRLVKIDVEGFEPSVLRGMAETLRRSAPAVVFEALDARALEACSAALRQCGFTDVVALDKYNYLAVSSIAGATSGLRHA